MRHPSELLIISLLVDGKSDSQVTAMVAEYGLPPVTEEQIAYIADLRARVKARKPAGFTGARTEDKKYLRELSVERI